MAVACPACGKTSQDAEFCDHCNVDLARPLVLLAPARCPLDESGVELTFENRKLLARGDQALLIQAAGASWRVGWLPPPMVEPRRHDLERRRGLALPSLAPCRWLEEQGGLWVLAETAAPWQPPWLAPPAEPLDELARLIDFAAPLAQALESLHGSGLVWLNFDPAYLEPAPLAEGLCFTNLDHQVFTFGQLPDDLRVHPAFGAPEILHGQAERVGPRTDVFHLALFCYYWLARLLPLGIPGQGLDAFDFELPLLRVYAPATPVGVQGVLARGLALDPRERFATPEALVQALRDVLERGRRRVDFNGAVSWELGWHTRTGRTKAALDRGNEDLIVVKNFTDPDRALAVVADGISTCDVGSGALASLIATILLENEFGGETHAADFLAHIEPICRRAAQTLLDWALEKGYADQLAQGFDLMGTTVTAGWLEGRWLTVANLGDSRAYLLDGHGAEQLTVDGDLGSSLLSEGTPPEEVQEMGGVSKALRHCVGGCTVDADGAVTVLEDSCRPAVSRWPVLPGDIFILCSDGLIEEGLFLEPDQVLDMVRTHAQLSAAELAFLLAEAADNLQRLPSTLEPDGFGDNISCVVIRIK